MSTALTDRKKKEKSYFDFTLLFIVIFLLCFGLVMLYSVSSYDANLNYGDSAFFLKKQLISTVFGIVAMVVVIFIDYHFWERFAFLAYIASAVLILMVLTPLGYEVNGARRWLNLGISLQPAEVAKVGMIIFYASIVCRLGKNIYSKYGLVLILVSALIISGMILVITENLSSAIIIFGIVFMMMFVSTPGYREYLIVAGTGITAAAVIVALVYNGVLSGEKNYRFARIEAWLNPEAYSSKESFQTLQSLYAIGSGDIFGKGLGQSLQKLGYIPEAQNDMIFSVICEELGLFGAFAIMLMFLIMIWRFFVIANNAEDEFGAMIVVGVMSHIAIQVILNIAVVTNTIPNTGITLPFISYGGSAVVFLLIEMGLVLSVARSIKLKSV
ncbi:MAG: putative lipid II flippase FtsW [Lachnospiraceae bacterium]|nr:putative lipid II flippase FtsW [Lachnospiraceae bacterium]